MVNRDRHDIVIEILKKASSPTKKTELMRDVGLSFSQSKQYVAMLVERGLLEASDRHRIVTTKKGMEFLKKCEHCPLFTWDK
jgi:predicted transcriptional regulator